MPDNEEPILVRGEILELAKLMELRLRSREDRPTRSMDRDHILNRIFEELCDMREAIWAGRPLLPDALDLALLSLRLLQSSGQLKDPESLSRDSIQIIDASRDPVRESHAHRAVRIGDRWILFGAELCSDEEVTNEMLVRTEPAILEAMRTLHAYNVKVGRIEVQRGRVRVFPEHGVKDPRSVEVEAIVHDTDRLPPSL